MHMVHVRARPGRVAFTAATGGRRIPQDQFIEIPLTPWIIHLIEDHQDIEFRQPETEPDEVAAAPLSSDPPASDASARTAQKRERRAQGDVA